MDRFEEIYEIVAGHRDPGPQTRWVSTVFADGTPYMDAFDRLWTHRMNLCSRLRTDPDDPDILGILIAAMAMEKEACRAMFLCGIESAARHPGTKDPPPAP